jgi:heat shock protein HslJ
MKQRKFQVLILTILVGLIIWSCKKEDIDIDIKSNNWEVVKIKKQGESTYEKAKENYILEFTNDTTFTLNLDVNNCFGNYEIIYSGNIKFKTMISTQICCDTDFAIDLIHLFPKMTEYYGKGNELIFEGQGEIILKQH